MKQLLLALPLLFLANVAGADMGSYERQHAAT